MSSPGVLLIYTCTIKYAVSGYSPNPASFSRSLFDCDMVARLRSECIISADTLIPV